MDADLKRLEDKISKLVSLCVTLREENTQLRTHLTEVELSAAKLKSNMLLASQKLEILLETMPADVENSDAVTTDEETS